MYFVYTIVLVSGVVMLCECGPDEIPNMDLTSPFIKRWSCRVIHHNIE